MNVVQNSSLVSLLAVSQVEIKFKRPGNLGSDDMLVAEDHKQKGVAFTSLSCLSRKVKVVYYGK